MTNLPPAGWYPTAENSDVQRYWDGQNWTEHTYTPEPVTEVLPQEPAPAPATEPVTEVLNEPESHQPYVNPENHNQQQVFHQQQASQQYPQQPYQQGGYQQGGYQQPYQQGGYPAHHQPAQKKTSKTPLIIILVILLVAALAVGGYFIWQMFMNNEPEPLPTATPTETTEPTPEPTVEPTPEPTEPPIAEVFLVDGPTDIGRLNPNLNYTVSVYGIGSPWADLGNAWDIETVEGNWYTFKSTVNSCYVLHTSGSPSEAGMTFTDPNDDVLSTFEFTKQLMPEAPDTEEYSIYGLWYSGIGQNDPDAVVTDLVAIDHEDVQSGVPGYIFSRYFSELDFAHYNYLLCDTLEEAEVAYYDFMNFEIVIEEE